MNASDYIKFNSEPRVYLASSHISKHDYGLYANKNFHRKIPMVIYYGTLMSNEDVMYIYQTNHELYQQMANCLRHTRTSVVYGDRDNSNTNLLGVYVNDISNINCRKQDVNEEILRKYADTHKLCNLQVVETADFPVYRTSKHVRKNEELTIHYGIGYWLLEIGCTPEEISDIDKRYNFHTMYENTVYSASMGKN